LKGLSADVILLNEYQKSYLEEMHEQLQRLLEKGTWAAWRDRPGGVFLLRSDGMPEGQRVVLLAAARVVFNGGHGDLADQLRLPYPEPSWPPALVARPAPEVAHASGAVGTVVRGVTGGSKADDGGVNMGATRDESGRKRRREEKRGKEGAPEVTVMASGCLGLISFPRIEGRATLEQLNEQYPRLVDGLRTHPGIGFLLVRSEEHGAVVLGPSGTNYLDEGRVEGEDPLAPYGPNAALHVKRTDTFPHCQDIMLNSTYWTDVHEVAAFEELCGSHGGMGGTQGRPFILYPARLPAPPHKIVGAENVHRQFVRWLVQLGHTAYDDLPDVPNRLVVPRAGDEVGTIAASGTSRAWGRCTVVI
jgi:hypothetical protein